MNSTEDTTEEGILYNVRGTVTIREISKVGVLICQGAPRLGAEHSTSLHFSASHILATNNKYLQSIRDAPEPIERKMLGLLIS
jgi:hypothetical protein